MKAPSRTRGGVDLVGRTYTRLRELIELGRLAPGTRIVETDLAVRLDVSRTPVRSALHRLQQEGWVVASGKGKQTRLSVSPLTQQDARELFQVVGTIEGLAARWAAELPEGERRRLTAELAELNEELRQEAAGAEPDPQRIFSLHSTFHRTLVGAVDAPRLAVLYTAVKPQADRYRRIYSTELSRAVGEAAREHDGVVAAIDRGADEAEAAVRTNWANAAERMARIIDAWGEKGSW